MSAPSNSDEEPKVKVPAPPRQRRGILAAVPSPAEAPDNLSKPNAGLQDMNFRMPLEFHRAFKIAAALRNMQMRELFEASFRSWVEQYGDDTIKDLLPPK